MEGEHLFTQAKEIKKENPLLKGPDTIDQSLFEGEDKSLDFVFSSDLWSYTLRYSSLEGSKILIEYFDKLPDNLTQEEKTKFRKERQDIKGTERDVFVLNLPENSEMNTGSPEEYCITEKRDFSKNGLKLFLNKETNREVL